MAKWCRKKCAIHKAIFCEIRVRCCWSHHHLASLSIRTTTGGCALFGLRDIGANEVVLRNLTTRHPILIDKAYFELIRNPRGHLITGDDIYPDVVQVVSPVHRNIFSNRFSYHDTGDTPCIVCFTTNFNTFHLLLVVFSFTKRSHVAEAKVWSKQHTVVVQYGRRGFH